MAGCITHFNCPSCGGTLSVEAGTRVCSCAHCGTLCLIETEHWLPQYYISPVIDGVLARRAVQKDLKDEMLPYKVVHKCMLQSSRLYMVPFYELTGRRLGTYTRVEKENRFHWEERPERQRHYPFRQSARREHTDTQVAMVDVCQYKPAVHITEWGLDGVNVSKAWIELNSTLRPFKKSAVQQFAEVFTPSLTGKECRIPSLERIDNHISQDNTILADRALKIIYYPVWRIKYQYRGRMYGMSVDGVTGEVLMGRAPAKESERLPWMIVTSGIVALVISQILRGLPQFVRDLASQSRDPWYADDTLFLKVVLIPFILFVVGPVIVSLLALGWDRFRYSKDVVFHGSDRTYEDINRPVNTLLDRARNAVFRTLGFLK